MELTQRIWLMQQELIALAEQKGCMNMDDPEIYEKSCLLDKLIVELIKSQQTKG